MDDIGQLSAQLDDIVRFGHQLIKTVLPQIGHYGIVGVTAGDNGPDARGI